MLPRFCLEIYALSDNTSSAFSKRREAPTFEEHISATKREKRDKGDSEVLRTGERVREKRREVRKEKDKED